MSQVSPQLRIVSNGYSHWCPACKEMHVLPHGWLFDGNMLAPTFSPSFKHTWGNIKSRKCCHYSIVRGIIHFYDDCTHELAGAKIPLPDLPPGYID